MASDKVDRLVSVMEYTLRRNDSGAQLSAIAQHLSGPLSSTHDLLRSMVGAGLLQVDSRKLYRVGPTFLRLAMSVLDQIDIRAAARPHLLGLSRSTGHDVYLAVRSGGSVIYIERIPGTRRAGLDIKLGEPVPLHSSAVGKLFAAFDSDLEELAFKGELETFTPNTITSRSALVLECKKIREQRFSISHEETISGIIGFGAPVWDSQLKLLAAVHVSAFANYVVDGDYQRIETEARDCAEAVSRALGREEAHQE